jgi:hypothetical protein
MGKTYRIRYGRTVNLGNYETCRIELEEEFNTDEPHDREDAIMHVARMVEAWATLRRKYPKRFLPPTDMEIDQKK